MPVAFYTKDEVDALIAGVSSGANFTIVELAAGTATPWNPTPIPSQSGLTTVALVTTDLAESYVFLPPESGTMGDLVEVHCMGPNALLAMPGRVGGSIDVINIAIRCGVTFRKISDTEWHPILKSAS